MSNADGLLPDSPELDHLSAAAYRSALQLGRFSADAIAAELSISTSEVARAQEVLHRLRLLHAMPGDPECLVPVSPDVAAAELVGPTEREVFRLQEAVREVRTRMRTLMPMYFESRRQRNRNEAFDLLNDKEVVRALLRDTSARCRTEVMAIQPGGPTPAEPLADAAPRDLAMIRRGVRMRSLYQHTARSDLATLAYVRDVTALGAEVRTSDELIDRLIVFDNEVAFIPARTVAEHSSGAVVIREPSLVTYLCGIFEHLWATATPFPAGDGKEEYVTDEVKLAILRLMAKGLKDDVVARRLGMSVRTCRRYVAQIMDELQATSRFQAGVAAAKHGLIGPEDLQAS